MLLWRSLLIIINNKKRKVKLIFETPIQVVRNRDCRVFGNHWCSLMSWPDWPWTPHFRADLYATANCCFPCKFFCGPHCFGSDLRAGQISKVGMDAKYIPSFAVFGSCPPQLRGPKRNLALFTNWIEVLTLWYGMVWY